METEPEPGNSHRFAESYLLNVPRITAIEIPGNVINTSRAIDMLGTQTAVAKVCRKYDNIKCTFPNVQNLI